MHSILTAFLAQTAPDAPNPLMQLVPFVLIAVVFYLVFFRPQQKQVKKHAQFVSELQKGQDVVTQAGIIGKIFQVEDKTVTLDLGGGTKVRVLKGNVVGAWQEKPATPAKPEKK